MWRATSRRRLTEIRYVGRSGWTETNCITSRWAIQLTGQVGLCLKRITRLFSKALSHSGTLLSSGRLVLGRSQLAVIWLICKQDYYKTVINATGRSPTEY